MFTNLANIKRLIFSYKIHRFLLVKFSNVWWLNHVKPLVFSQAICLFQPRPESMAAWVLPEGTLVALAGRGQPPLGHAMLCDDFVGNFEDFTVILWCVVFFVPGDQ